MAMEISKAFLVHAPVEAAWVLLTDPVRVAACLPGAAITERIDDQTYRGTVTVKVGPVSASYKGTMRFARLDHSDHSAEIVASGSDTRGRGGADMVMSSRLVERVPGETQVTIVSEVNVMGVLAQFGRGMIQDVSDQIFERFVAAVRAQLEGASGQPLAAATADAGPAGASAAPAPSAPADGGLPASAPVSPPIDALSFGSAVLGRAARRAAGRPTVWVAAALAATLAVWRTLRRRRRAAWTSPKGPSR